MPEHAKALRELIDGIRQYHSVCKLDITHGSMSSQTAEAVYVTMINAVEFLHKYFHYIGQDELVCRVTSKALTTRLIECFFGHITLSVQGNNLGFLDMKRRLVNEAFTFLLPYVDPKRSGIPICTGTEKEHMGDTYSYSQHDLVIDNAALIWRLLDAKASMFTVGQKRALKKSHFANPECAKPSGFCFGRADGCMDYMTSVYQVTEEMKPVFKEVTRALRSRPMKTLRAFHKRKFGTAPTVLGSKSCRRTLENEDATLAYVFSEQGTVASKSTEHEFFFQANTFVVFRGTPGFVFNIIQLDRSYHKEALHPDCKMYGNFLVPVENEEEEGSNVLFWSDPQWEGGSMMLKDALLDEDGNLVTIDMVPKTDNKSSSQMFYMTLETFEGLVELSHSNELVAQARSQEEKELEKELKSVAEEEELDSEEEDERTDYFKPSVLDRRERRNRGNRWGFVMGELL